MMQVSIKEYQDKIDALSLRERGMILLAVVAVIVFLWDSLLMQPVNQRQSILNAQLEIERAELAAKNIKMRNAIAASQQDPNAVNREKLSLLKEQLAAVEEQVRSTATDMIEPSRMPSVLRGVISETQGLTLLQLQGLGATALVTQDDESSGEKANQNAAGAYKHGLEITLRGDYLTTLEYLRRLQAQDWHFFWDGFDLRVGDYPETRSVLTIYTLSLTRDWIRA